MWHRIAKYIPAFSIFWGLDGAVASVNGVTCVVCGWLSERISVSRRLFSELSDGERMADVMVATVWAPNADADGVGGVDDSSLSAGGRTNS